MSEKVNDVVAAEARYRIAELAARAAGDQLRSLVDRGLEMTPASAAQVVVDAWRAALAAAVATTDDRKCESPQQCPAERSDLQPEQSKHFLESLTPQMLKVGDGGDNLPVWIGVDPDAQKVYRVYACGLVEGFGDGRLISRLGVGQYANQPSEVCTQGPHISIDIGVGVDRRLTLFGPQRVAR